MDSECQVQDDEYFGHLMLHLCVGNAVVCSVALLLLLVFSVVGEQRKISILDHNTK